MELLLTLTAILIFAIIASIPAQMHAKKTGKKRPSGAMSGALGVVNELFAPSAQNAAIIVEEQREAIKPMPSPEDKKKPGGQTPQ
jgi:hypothetical protein